MSSLPLWLEHQKRLQVLQQVSRLLVNQMMEAVPPEMEVLIFATRGCIFCSGCGLEHLDTVALQCKCATIALMAKARAKRYKKPQPKRRRRRRRGGRR